MRNALGQRLSRIGRCSGPAFRHQDDHALRPHWYRRPSQSDCSLAQSLAAHWQHFERPGGSTAGFRWHRQSVRVRGNSRRKVLQSVTIGHGWTKKDATRSRWRLMEAAGIEPASRGTSVPVSTCVADLGFEFFTRVRLPLPRSAGSQVGYRTGV